MHKLSTLTNEQQAEDCSLRTRGRPRSEVAKKRILEAALESIEELGFVSTTTDIIAERAGASKATIYRWWPTKAALLAEALREAVAQELPFPYTGDLAGDIHRQLLNFMHLLNGRLGRAFKAFVGAAQSDPEMAAAFLSVWVKPRRAEAKAVLERHKQDGHLSGEVDLDLLLDVLYGPMYFRLLSGHGSLSPDYASAVTAFALKAFAQPHQTF